MPVLMGTQSAGLLRGVLVGAISAMSAREWGGGMPPRLMVGPPNGEAGRQDDK